MFCFFYLSTLPQGRTFSPLHRQWCKLLAVDDGLIKKFKEKDFLLEEETFTKLMSHMQNLNVRQNRLDADQAHALQDVRYIIVKQFLRSKKDFERCSDIIFAIQVWFFEKQQKRHVFCFRN